MQSSRSLTLVTALRLCLCTSFLASALTPPASLAGQRPDSARLTFRVPDSIGVFALAGRKDYDDPSHGIMLGYRPPERIDGGVRPRGEAHEHLRHHRRKRGRRVLATPGSAGEKGIRHRGF